MRELQPINQHVLLELERAAEEKTASGIIIPDTAKEKPQKGTVVTVGPGKRDDSGKLIPMELKAGDKVLVALEEGVRHFGHKIDETITEK